MRLGGTPIPFDVERGRCVVADPTRPEPVDLDAWITTRRCAAVPGDVMDRPPNPLARRALVALLGLLLFGFCVSSNILLHRLFPWLPRSRHRRSHFRHRRR